MIGRPSQAKKSKARIREILINAKVTSQGIVLAWDDVYNDEQIMRVTGFYNKKHYERTGEYKAVSKGTRSYHVKKYNLSEREVFDYHIESGRLPASMNFEDFRCNVGRHGNGNARKKKQPKDIYEAIIKSPRQKCVDMLNDIGGQLNIHHALLHSADDDEVRLYIDMILRRVSKEELEAYWNGRNKKN